MLVAAGAGVMAGEQPGLAGFTAMVALGWGVSLVAFLRDPSVGLAAAVLVAAGFLRLLLGPVGLGALLAVPLVAVRVDAEHTVHLVGAALGIHLAVFASKFTASLGGEAFPTLHDMTGGEALVGAGWFVPILMLARSSKPDS